MRLNCELEVVYALAVAKGGAPSRSSRARASICLGKKPAPGSSGEGQAAKRDELYLIVSTAKNVTGNKYKVRPILYPNPSNSCGFVYFLFRETKGVWMNQNNFVCATTLLVHRN